MTYLDIENWSRREHFHFFRAFDEPFWGIVVDVDCDFAYRYCKEHKLSFFLYYLYCATRAANDIVQFRYRIVDEEKVQIVDRVDASAVINRADGSFGFSHIIFDPNWSIWNDHATKEIKTVRADTKLFPNMHHDACIHFSSMPWLKFRSLSHARKFHIGDSVPKISFGKTFTEHGALKMPVSVHVHHSLVDGKDVGEYIEKMQYYLNDNSDFIT